MKNKAKAVLYTFICVVLWALIPVVSKLGQVNLDNHQFLFWSSAVSFIAFLITTIIVGHIKLFFSYKINDWLNTVFLGFLGTYLYYILLYFGYANAQGLEVLVLQYSWPIFIVILSIFILKEKLTLKRFFSILFGFLGVLIILTKGNFTQVHLDNYFVDILILIAAFTFGLFSVLSKKTQLEPYTMITIYFLTATIASFISMLWFSNFSLPTKGAIIPILVNGLLVNGLSYIFWIKALKQAEASFIAPFVFLTPVLAAIYLIIFFREPLLPIYGLGLLAVIIGGLLNKEKSINIS
ncbi:permease [Candidatus Wolfebacteria bacterium CG10_big_fil_rev_8_21_14_0_10_31_9]|uniref:Permease n=1 Tax=Candidatus Wolfebacteria bacterium CG10_big_fil_rev_8_21_14_0_10_31_9 TaxID=1975070 RepID=A0A2H0RCU6_9BACT|nr:MAG: permease [Candidatus Wolfebacteria bacterium CG10_big_fil_rev_8_21_14_0_10_31_9]